MPAGLWPAGTNPRGVEQTPSPGFAVSLRELLAHPSARLGRATEPSSELVLHADAEEAADRARVVQRVEADGSIGREVDGRLGVEHVLDRTEDFRVLAELPGGRDVRGRERLDLAAGRQVAATHRRREAARVGLLVLVADRAAVVDVQARAPRRVLPGRREADAVLGRAHAVGDVAIAVGPGVVVLGAVGVGDALFDQVRPGHGARVSAPYAPSGHLVLASTSTPLVSLDEEFTNLAKPCRMPPGSFGEILVAGSRMMWPTSTAVCASSRTGRPVRLMRQRSPVKLDLGVMSQTRPSV